MADTWIDEIYFNYEENFNSNSKITCEQKLPMWNLIAINCCKHNIVNNIITVHHSIQTTVEWDLHFVNVIPIYFLN